MGTRLKSRVERERWRDAEMQRCKEESEWMWVGSEVRRECREGRCRAG
jgi:hypothetical protein